MTFPLLQFVSSKLGKLNLWHWTNWFVQPDFGWDSIFQSYGTTKIESLPWKEPHIWRSCDPGWWWCCSREACQMSSHCTGHTQLTVGIKWETKVLSPPMSSCCQKTFELLTFTWLSPNLPLTLTLTKLCCFGWSTLIDQKQAIFGSFLRLINFTMNSTSDIVKAVSRWQCTLFTPV